jgi:hypothetical protein
MNAPGDAPRRSEKLVMELVTGVALASKNPNLCSGFEIDFRVTRAGFEPAISTLRGWRPGPLDERASLQARRVPASLDDV